MFSLEHPLVHAMQQRCESDQGDLELLHLHGEGILCHLTVYHDTMDANLVDIDIESKFVHARSSRLARRIEAFKFADAVLVALNGESLPEKRTAWFGVARTHEASTAVVLGSWFIGGSYNA